MTEWHDYFDALDDSYHLKSPLRVAIYHGKIVTNSPHWTLHWYETEAQANMNIYYLN
jgi:hypothetical protein